MKNYTIIYKLLSICIICIVTGGCNHSGKFTVKGVVAGAAGQILYIENTGVTPILTMDSIKIKADGRFSFTKPRPSYPDFYRLRLKNQTIHFSVDSTETISFTADAHNFSTSYMIEGSENGKAIKEIALAQLDANQEIKKLRDSYGMNLIPDSIYQKNFDNAVKLYKETATKYIFAAPMSPTAYFALFQQIDGLWLFDPYNREDSKAYAAVATSYKAFSPENPRSKQLETLALQSLKVIRGEQQRKIGMENVSEIDYIDIELPDINGKNIKLSNVAKGKAVLVNFTAFQAEWSPEFNIKLNELYGKYRERGFEIYQISLDSDIHFWKNAVSNIPWISVYDPQSVYSSVAAIYNVRQIPALFLINKKGEMVKRIESADTLENDIRGAL